jgi:hypothetical protein
VIKVYIDQSDTELPIKDFIAMSLSKMRANKVPELRFRIEGTGKIAAQLRSKDDGTSIAEANGDSPLLLKAPLPRQPTNVALLIQEGDNAQIQVDMIFTA